MGDKATRRILLLNAAGLLGLAVAALYGVPQSVFVNDSSHVTVFIAAAFLFAMQRVFTRDTRTARQVASLLVMLGLIGTTIGASGAFLALDPTTFTDPAKGAASVAAALHEFGTGIVCTILGSVTNVWTTVCCMVAERGDA
jgi:drug/metabolite transporter (DMT)-like permease